MHRFADTLPLRLTLPALALLGACASGPDHVQIKFPSSDGRNKDYECQTTEDADKAGKSKCWKIHQRPSPEENKGGTLHFIPPDCKGGFDFITVENLDSDQPRLFVVCQPETNE